jgi:hypothetical protein
MRDEVQRACYREIVRKCHPNVLSAADRAWTEIVACLLAEFRASPKAMKVTRLGRLMAGLSALGMSPADRSRAATIPRAKLNPFAQFTR